MDPPPRHSVTASGPEEANELQTFLAAAEPALRQVVSKHLPLFQPPDRDPPDRSVKHFIHVAADCVPAARQPYPLADTKREALRTQMRELIDKGWVVPSSSPWAAPILFVAKDGGSKLRMCVDFRDLNALTKKDRYPLPRLDQMLQRSAAATHFSKIDLASGFHQIEVHPAHRELTAFTLPEAVDGHSLWEWKVMPFGLVNAPATFQRAMSVALRECTDYTSAYIDDILVFSKGLNQHYQHLDAVFQALQDQAYHARLAKCKFVTTSVPFLGHILTATGIDAAGKRFDLAENFPTPFKSPKQVKSFLGMVMWYKSFLSHLATLAAPLFPLTSTKSDTFTWTQEATDAVEALKKALCDTPLLAYFDRSLPTRVTTDASTVGLGAVLEQRHQDDWRPVAFWSRKLRDPETRYSATDLEWLAVVEAVSRIWPHYLEDVPFTLRSDYFALSRKLAKSSHDPPLTPRQSRWIERLMPFPLTYEYLPGVDNVVADTLSRYPSETNAIENKATLQTVTLIAPQLVGLLQRVKLAAEMDGKYKQHRDLLSSRGESTDRPPAPDSSKLPDESSYTLFEGVIFKTSGQVVLPEEESLRTLAISEAHDGKMSGHFGYEKTLEKVRRFWEWEGLARDVRAYVRSCPRCQQVKHATRKSPGLLQPILAQRPWQIVSLDFVGRFAPADGSKRTHCLVIVDKFTKYVMLEAVHETVTAEQTAEVFIRRVISNHGIPTMVISDRGPQFAARLWKDTLALMGSTVALATTHHPQTDGQTERAIQTFLRILRTFALRQEDQWEKYLPFFQYAINDSYCEAIRSTPFLMLYGMDPVSPLPIRLESSNDHSVSPEPTSPLSLRETECGIPEEDELGRRDFGSHLENRRRQLQVTWDFVRAHQLEIANRMKIRYDQNRKDLKLELGDLVFVSTKSHPLLHTVRKQQETKVGPYVVVGRINDNAYELEGLPAGVPRTQNVSYLTPYVPSPDHFRLRPDYRLNLPQEEGDEWE